MPLRSKKVEEKKLQRKKNPLMYKRPMDMVFLPEDSPPLEMALAGKTYMSVEERNSFLLGVTEGTKGIKQILKEIGVGYTTYLRTKRKFSEFALNMEEARRERADLRHENLQASEITPLQERSTSDMNAEELSEYKLQMETLQKKQNIIAKSMELDSPKRFGGRDKWDEGKGQGNIDINISVSDEVMDKIRGKFTPKVDKRSDDIVLDEGQFKEKT